MAASEKFALYGANLEFEPVSETERFILLKTAMTKGNHKLTILHGAVPNGRGVLALCHRLARISW